MVKLEEVQDEEFAQEQVGPTEGEDDWEDDSDASDASSIASSTLAEETIFDRIAALKDIIPPAQRRKLSSTLSTSYDWARSSVAFSGKALWVVSTSALLLGVPWALAYAEEQQMIEMEREMKMQQSAQDLLSAGGAQQGQQTSPAL